MHIYYLTKNVKSTLKLTYLNKRATFKYKMTLLCIARNAYQVRVFTAELYFFFDFVGP